MKQILNTMTLAALAGLVTFANSALADAELARQQRIDERSFTVHFGDLNPSVPADADALLARVRLAVRNACIRNDEYRQIFLSDDRQACEAQSYASAIARINAKRKVDLEAVAARHDEGRNLNAAR